MDAVYTRGTVYPYLHLISIFVPCLVQQQQQGFRHALVLCDRPFFGSEVIMIMGVGL